MYAQLGNYHEFELSLHPCCNSGTHFPLYSRCNIVANYTWPKIFFGWKFIWLFLAERILALGFMDSWTSDYINRIKRSIRRAIGCVFAKRFTCNPSCSYRYIFRKSSFITVQK